ncbi:MAG: hypothetical protein MUO80_08655 [Dehalococcoidia bacterium]|nr:hypothetical protein [Dehalococcoidia bacterium]
MAKVQVRKCLICGVRPSNGQNYCKQCTSQIEADKRRKAKPKVFRYVTYQDVTFEFRSGKNGTLTPQYITRNPDTLPQKLLINLNKYVPGLTREQVKKLKRLCLSFAE